MSYTLRIEKTLRRRSRGRNSQGTVAEKRNIPGLVRINIGFKVLNRETKPDAVAAAAV